MPSIRPSTRLAAVLALLGLLAGCTANLSTQSPALRGPCCSVAGQHYFRKQPRRSELPGLSRERIQRLLAREDFSQFYDRDQKLDVIALDPRRVAMIPDVAQDIRARHSLVPANGSCGTPLHTGEGLCHGVTGIVEKYKARIAGPFVAMNVSFFGDYDSRRVRAIAGDVVIGRQLKLDSLGFVPMPDAYHRMLLGIQASGGYRPAIFNHTASCSTTPYQGLTRDTRPWPCASGRPTRSYEPADYLMALTGLGDPYDPVHLPGEMSYRTVQEQPGQFVSYPVSRVVVGVTPEHRLIFAHAAGLAARQVADRLAGPPYNCDRQHMAFFDGGSSTHVYVRFRNAQGRLQETELPAAGECQNIPVWLVLARRTDVIHERLADFPSVLQRLAKARPQTTLAGASRSEPLQAWRG